MLEAEPYHGSTKGVVTGHLADDSINGYAVRFENALKALEEHNPQAAAWWQENNAAKSRPDRLLIFKPKDCTVLIPEIQVAEPKPEEWWG